MTGKPYRTSHEYSGSASETETIAPPSADVVEKQQRQSVNDFLADLGKATSRVKKQPKKKQASRRGSRSPKTSA